MASEFMQWFEAQFGKKPGGPLSDEQLHDEAIAAESIAIQLRRKCDLRERWNRVKDAALLAWTATRPEPGDAERKEDTER